MAIPEYRVPLPKGASKKAIDLSKEVNKWANIESSLLFQVDDLEMLQLRGYIGENNLFRELFLSKSKALDKAEKEFDKALHAMCEAL